MQKASYCFENNISQGIIICILYTKYSCYFSYCNVSINYSSMKYSLLIIHSPKSILIAQIDFVPIVYCKTVKSYESYQKRFSLVCLQFQSKIRLRCRIYFGMQDMGTQIPAKFLDVFDPAVMQTYKEKQKIENKKCQQTGQ